MTTDGTVVGEHEGIEGFTVGQRKGLGVALGERKFVVRIEPESRRVVIGDRGELDRRELTAAMQLARTWTRPMKLKNDAATLKSATTRRRSRL